jgi:hypothetical protein
MTSIIAYSHQGGKDLYMGVPNLDSATLVSTTQVENKDYYATKLNFKLANGLDFFLVIKQEK